MRGLNQKFLLMLLLLNGLVWCVSLGHAQTKVYLLAGQSNMVGWCSNSGLPPELQQPRPDIPIYWQNYWQYLQPGLGSDSGKFGPEITFGWDMFDSLPDNNIVLVKYAVSGTTLWNDWRATDGVEYVNFINKVNNALSSVDEPEIMGMIWMQGEFDAYPPTSTLSYAQAYEQNLTDFIESIRSDLGLPDMPFVIGQISESPVWTWGDIVRQDQLNVSRTVPNTSLVVTSDLGILADGMHYNASGTMTLGSRFADATLDLEFPVSKASSSTDDATLSWSHAIGDGINRILVVGVVGKDDSADDLEVSSVTYNDVDMDLIEGSSKSVQFSNMYLKTELYYLLDSNLPLTGSHMIEVTYSGNVSKRCAGAFTLMNVVQQTAEAVVTNSSEDANTISSDIITQTDESWIVDIVGSSEQGLFIADSNQQIKRIEISSDNSTAAGSTAHISSAGLTEASWNFGDGNSILVHSAAAFRHARCAISGYIVEPNYAPIEDVLIMVDSGGESSITDPNGYYEVLVPYKWSGTVTPTKYKYVFGPSQKIYNNIVDDQPSQEFEGVNITLYDFDEDGLIGWGDVSIMCQNWLNTGPEGDVNDDGIVNFEDFAELALVW
jgi:hypothetical protein